MAKKIGFLYVDGQLTLVLNGHPHDVDPKHPKFDQIVSTMKRPENETDEEEAARAEKLLSMVRNDDLLLRKAAAEIGLGDVVVEHGVVTVKGKQIHTSLSRRILELKQKGLPYEPLVNFLVNLEKNPSEESKRHLFDFLEQGRFPLTEDGCFLGYKGVRSGTLTREDGTTYATLVDCHSGKFDMSPGNRHSMPWDAVDDNRNQACGAGFHVGTIGHARGFGSTMIVVKVNPKDCVSVPAHDTTKLRCCEYEVVNVYSDRNTAQEFSQPVYKTEEVRKEDFEKDEEEYVREEEEAALPSRRANLEAMGRDDICRLAAAEGIFVSTNEARWIGKNLVVEALLLGDLPLDLMERDQVAELAVRRRLFTNVPAALKKGLEAVKDALRADQAKRKKSVEDEE